MLPPQRADAIRANPTFALNVEWFGEANRQSSSLALVFKINEALSDGLEGDQIQPSPVGSDVRLHHLYSAMYDFGRVSHCVSPYVVIRCYSARKFLNT
jgi:hypothetical protein